jgi:NADPH:quinone reductase-like Zn-dependent oxidoreductase
LSEKPMQAIILKGFGDVSNLHLEELPLPLIGDLDVLIEVKAISINPVDVKTRKGKGAAEVLKKDPPMILGWDVSGEIVQVGSLVGTFKSGDEVFGMVNFPGAGKTYATYVAAPAAHLALKPVATSHEEAAGASLAALTAYQALAFKAGVHPGQRVLIQAASGGVGHFAVQIAKLLGAYVIGTASEANRDFVLGLGADEFVDYRLGQLKDHIQDVELVLDMIGGDTIDQSLEVMRPGGKIISIPSGANTHVVEKAQAKGMIGQTFMVASNGRDMQQIAKWLETGQLRTHIAGVFPFYQMDMAHESLETGRTRGKIIVTP